MVNFIRWSPAVLMEMRPFVSSLGLLEEVEEMARTAFENIEAPSLEMREEEKELVVKGKLPGFIKKDLDIRLDDGYLTIKAEHKTVKTTQESKKPAGETAYRDYRRYITLPGPVDAENVTATFKKGVLEIRLPKAETPPARQIEIKTK